MRPSSHCLPVRCHCRPVVAGSPTRGSTTTVRELNGHCALSNVQLIVQHHCPTCHCLLFNYGVLNDGVISSCWMRSDLLSGRDALTLNGRSLVACGGRLTSCSDVALPGSRDRRQRPSSLLWRQRRGRRCSYCHPPLVRWLVPTHQRWQLGEVRLTTAPVGCELRLYTDDKLQPNQSSQHGSEGNLMGQQNVNGSRVIAVRHLLYKIFTEYVISRIPDCTSLQRREGNRLVVNSSWFMSGRDRLYHGLGLGHGWRVMRVTGQLTMGHEMWPIVSSGPNG